MRDIPQRVRQKATDHREIVSTVALVFMVFMMVATASTVAQTQVETWDDDFSDGTVDGWSNPIDGSPQISSDSVEGDWSLHAQTTELSSQDQPAYHWNDGPELDMQDDFVVEGTVKPYQPIEGASMRLGIPGFNQEENGENAFLIFDNAEGQTFLATSTLDEANDPIETSFNNEWVNFRLESDEDSDTIDAYVWEHGTEEPEEPSLSRSGFEGISGQFSVNPGYDEPSGEREIWLDSVHIEGTEATDPRLSIETSSLMLHGDSQPYEIEYDQFNQTTAQNETLNVTEEASLESLDQEGITVDEETHTLHATNSSDYNDRVELRAEYNESVAFKYVTVATVTVDNLDVLPPIYRITATLGDDTIFLFIIATLTGIVASRGATAFAGLSLMEMVVVIGWLGGYVGTGMAMVSLFAALFIGFNLAANIDYTVRR